MVGNLSFLCVYEWWYARGFLLVLRASFRGLTGAKLWENVGRRGMGKKVWGLFQGDDKGDRVARLNILCGIIDRAYCIISSL